MRQRNELTCLYTNAILPENKIDEFKVLRDECKPDLMGILKSFSKVRQWIVVHYLPRTKPCGYTGLLILSVFNFSVIKCSNGEVSSVNACESSIEVCFKDILNDEFFIQHVKYPNFQLYINKLVNTLDLIYITLDESIDTLEYLPTLGNQTKGHLVIKFNFIHNE